MPDRWDALARVLKRDRGEFKQRITRSQDRGFMWLARQLPPNEVQAVRDLDMPGVYFKQESRRYYPQAEVTGHILGVTDIDDMGQEGIELAWDYQLAGQPGRKRVIQDRMGRVVEDVENIKTARPGRDLTISIDSRIQYLAYRETETRHRGEPRAVGFCSGDRRDHGRDPRHGEPADVQPQRSLAAHAGDVSQPRGNRLP